MIYHPRGRSRIAGLRRPVRKNLRGFRLPGFRIHSEETPNPMSLYSNYGDPPFEADYFEGGTVGGYREYPTERNLELTSEYASEINLVVQATKVLVVGCGTGLTVDYLASEHGWNRVYGMDISQWAVDRRVTDRVYQGDAFEPADYDAIARDAAGPPRWDGIYTELVLEHYDDEQATEIYDITREIADGRVVHRIWSGTSKDWERDEFNLKTIAEWKALLDPNDEHSDVDWIDFDRPSESTI